MLRFDLARSRCFSARSLRPLVLADISIVVTLGSFKTCRESAVVICHRPHHLTSVLLALVRGMFVKEAIHLTDVSHLEVGKARQREKRSWTAARFVLHDSANVRSCECTWNDQCSISYCIVSARVGGSSSTRPSCKITSPSSTKRLEAKHRGTPSQIPFATPPLDLLVRGQPRRGAYCFRRWVTGIIHGLPDMLSGIRWEIILAIRRRI